MNAGEPGIDRIRLLELLHGEGFVTRLLVEDSVTSTNDALRQLAAAGAAAGTVLVADHQTAGRGRMGRGWFSPRSTGLYLSILLRPRGPAAMLTRWTLAAAVAACDACRSQADVRVEIKWPNDLVWRGKKLGGILAESRTGVSLELILGVGLNLALPPAGLPDALSSSATSLRSAGTGRTPDRESLAAAFLRELAGVARLLETDAWDAVSAHWERLAPGAHDLQVRVIDETGTTRYRGTTAGLAADGALRIRRDGGGIEMARMADSVLPL